MIPPKAVSTADDIYTYALPMMAKLERDIPGMKLRLMGLRCTNLVSTNKRGIDFFGTGEQLSKPASRPNISAANKASTEAGEEDQWEVWPEGEFEEAARHEREDEMNEIEQLSQELQDLESTEKTVTVDPSPSTIIRSKHKALENLNAETPQRQNHYNNHSWSCPICGRSQPGNDKTFNAHIDYCLSRQTIKEAAARETSPAPAPAPAPAPQKTSSSSSPPISLSLKPEAKARRGRGRPPKKRRLAESENEGKKQRLLFGK